jgi:hypothetical protein
MAADPAATVRVDDDTKDDEDDDDLVPYDMSERNLIDDSVPVYARTRCVSH